VQKVSSHEYFEVFRRDKTKPKKRISGRNSGNVGRHAACAEKEIHRYIVADSPKFKKKLIMTQGPSQNFEWSFVKNQPSHARCFEEGKKKASNLKKVMFVALPSQVNLLQLISDI